MSLGGERVLMDQIIPGLIRQRVTDAQSARAKASNMPMEAVCGYPVPQRLAGDAWLVFPFFLRRGKPRTPPRLSGFGWLARVDIETGTRVLVERQTTDLSISIGVHELDPTLTMAAFEAAEERLYAAMDLLVPIAFTAVTTIPDDARLAADAYVKAWRIVAHKPLMESYRTLNPDWFALLGL